MDALDRKLLDSFEGKVVRKDLLHRIKKGTNVPTFVLEFLLARYCASDDPAEIQVGLEAVLADLQDNYVKPDEANAAQSRVATKGKHRFIDKVHVRYVEKEKRHWATLENFNSQRVAIAERFYRETERLLEGGIWAEVTVAHNDIEDDDYAFYVEDLRPVQLSRFDFEQYARSRKKFTRDEWIEVILRSVGLEPEKLSKRVRFHFMARLAPLVEANYNFVELGPRGTGKSYFFSEFSPYSTLLSGGQATKATLFYNNARRRVGLIGFWDTVAFDEVGGINIRDPDAIQIMKDYMANGRFSRGVEVIADASLAFVGNFDQSVEQVVRSSQHDLFLPLPPEFDLAVMDRFASYLPGWEMPKNSSEFLTNNYGLITDYLAEAFHHQFAHSNRYEEVNKRIRLGRDVEGRDEKGIKKTVCAFVKILHPDGPPGEGDFEDYVAYAVESRRRVKEQMNKRKPDDEFAKINLSYVSREQKDVTVYCPESKDVEATQNPVRKGLKREPKKISEQPGNGNGSPAAPPGEVGGGNGSASSLPVGKPVAQSSAAPLEVYQGYELVQALDSAGMAEAFKARRASSGEVVFLKRVRIHSKKDRDAMEREMQIYDRLMRMQSQHVLQVLDVLRDEEYKGFVTEFADGDDLESYVQQTGSTGTLEVSEAKAIGIAIAEALKELHGLGIVHRDLKPRNVLFSKGRWKLTDFGISKNLDRAVTKRTFQQFGTLGYTAPEQFDGVSAHPSADIYSFGKVLVFLLSGQTDVDHVHYPSWRKLIQQCTQVNPEQRPSIEPVLEELRGMAG